MPRPLLMISDSISCSSGLGRITRDLATRIHKNLPEYRVATAGYGGPGSSKFSFPQYHFHSVENWQLPELPIIARDFFGDEDQTIMFVWDLSRIGWFADPRQCPMPHVRRWLESTVMRKWLYHPIDAAGPNGKLSTPLATTMKGFDRVLDYTAFSCSVTGNTEHLPHGIDTAQFYPRDRVEAKRAFRKQGFIGLREDSFLIGIVATNQARKDWALGIQTCRALLDRGLDVKVWCHIDTLDRYWSMANLITDYGMQGRVVITTSNFTDDQMAGMYAACDVTLGIGLGEGFGYSTFESLACGTPHVTGDYGGGAEYLAPCYKVKPIAYRYEGPFCCRRPVYNVEDWADAAEDVRGRVASLPEELDWDNLWPRWAEWFVKGVK